MSRLYDFSRISVLVAEDNSFMASLISSMLLALRIGRVHHAADGSAAMRMIEDRAASFSPHSGFGIDIIISDWVMKPVDGIEFLRWVRAHPKDQVRFLPFIMLTAYPEAKRVITARDYGNTEFVRKPLSAETLIGRLVEVIEHPRPFVRAPSYFGPDRRRRVRRFDGPERRGAEQDPPAEPASRDTPESAPK